MQQQDDQDVSSVKTVLHSEEKILPALTPLEGAKNLQKFEASLTLERVIQRLKEAQLRYVESEVKDLDLYTPLEGFYDVYSASSKRYKLVEEIVAPFLRKIDKETLLILGEAGSGKTKFAEYLTQELCLKKEKEDLKGKGESNSKEKYLVPLYVRLVDSRITNLEDRLIEGVLRIFDLSDKEIALLLTSKEVEFCFIFDGVDELVRKDKTQGTFYKTNNISRRFPGNHCIFTSRLSGLPASYETFFEPELVGSEAKMGSRQERAIQLAPFNEESKKDYIASFIEKRQIAKEFSYTTSKEVYDRIASLPSLIEVVRRPLLLMMTMSVLPYLEGFYKHENEFQAPQVVRRDIFHMYTHYVFKRAAEKFYERNRSLESNINVYEDIVYYSIELAKLMCTPDHTVNEVAMDDILGGNRFIGPRPPAQGLTEKQIREFKRYFSTKLDSKIYEEGQDEFEFFKRGREGCDLLDTRGRVGHLIYRFIHDDFLEYFSVLTPDALRGRRQKIEVFMEQYDKGRKEKGFVKILSDVQVKKAGPAAVLGTQQNFFMNELQLGRKEVLLRVSDNKVDDQMMKKDMSAQTFPPAFNFAMTENKGGYLREQRPEQIERYGIFSHEKKDSSEKQNICDRAIPPEFSLGIAKGRGDCFFDAFAEKLNELSGREEYTVKSLRLLCHEYAVELDKQCGGDPNHADNWIARSCNNTAKYQAYLANVRFTVEEREAGEGVGGDKLAISGEQHLDGRMITEKLNFKLHVIQLRENPEEETNQHQKFIISHNLVDKEGLRNVDGAEINWSDERTVHIAVYNLHCVPIIKKVNQQLDRSLQPSK